MQILIWYGKSVTWNARSAWRAWPNLSFRWQSKNILTFWISIILAGFFIFYLLTSLSLRQIEHVIKSTLKWYLLAPAKAIYTVIDFKCLPKIVIFSDKLKVLVKIIELAGQLDSTQTEVGQMCAPNTSPTIHIFYHYKCIISPIFNNLMNNYQPNISFLSKLLFFLNILPYTLMAF